MKEQLEELVKEALEIEALKSEHKYPIYCLSKSNGLVIKFLSLDEGVVVKQDSIWNVGDKTDCWDLHTDTDFWQQLDVCPETGFYDGQLVWAWDEMQTHERLLRFYDAKNKRTFLFDGDRGLCFFDNYEPYEGNWPSWALEAFKTLKK